ncbi:toprim domain-containing protein [Streptomyces sp. NPDC056056]|uniref:toprim domain-containing protein n=1 Tax=Streptomyces sp. NPDC056056 TaxID=3345698 RepID=UPI0035DB7B2D
MRTADYMVALMARIDIEVETQLRADTGMDEPNRERLQRAKDKASDVVPGMGWSQALLDVMKLAAAGRLTTGDDGLFRQQSEGSGAGRRVSTQRVQLLLEAGFLAMPPEASAVRSIRPTAQGEQALFLAALHPEGIYPDDGTAFEARLKAVRRPWHNKEDSKSAARRLPPLDKWAMMGSDDRPQRLSDEEHESAVRALVMFAYDDLERVAARLWKANTPPQALAEVRDALAAADLVARDGGRSAAAQAFNTAHAYAGLFGRSLDEDPRGEEATEWIGRLQKRIDEYTGAWAPTGAVARAQAPANEVSGPSPQSRTTKPTVPAVPRSATPAPTSETTQPTASAEREAPTGDGQSEVSEPDSQPSPAAEDGDARRDPASASPATTAPRSAAPSGPDTTHLLQMQWTLPLGPTPPPLGDEEQATAVAVKASLSANALIDLLAAAYAPEAYSEWKRRYLSRGGGSTQVGSTPVRYESYSDRLEATVGDTSVTVTWDRVRAWVREIATPEVVIFLNKAKTAASRIPHHGPGEERWQAMGELALARMLRERVEAVKKEVLDHAIGYLSSRSIPANARGGRPAAAHAGGQGLFDVDGPFVLPPMNEVNEDLDRIITLLPAPTQNEPKRVAALSELTPGTVIELDGSPIVISEINLHPGRVDIVGEHRGPVRPHRVKHSLDLTTDSDPSFELADLPPSLAPLIGAVPRREMGNGPGPLVDGHPDASGQIQPAAGGTVPQPPAGPPQQRIETYVWDAERRRAHGQGIGQANGTRPPVSKARREMDPDDPLIQFVDNLEHQLLHLTERPSERAAVEQAAREIREAVTDLAARARAYSTERLRQAERNPARLLQITLEPPLSGPFTRLAMNSVMSAIDRAEAAVPQVGQKARVRAALEAVVCSSPPRDPQGDALADFGDALAPFFAMDGRTSDTVAELMATPEQWTHFNLMASEVHQLTSQTASTAQSAARFATLNDVRLHLTALASEEISADSGPQREHALDRARRAARLANDPSLELAPSGKLLVHGSVRDGWHVVAPGSAKDVVPWPVRTRKHALAFAGLLVRLTDESGAAYPWDADDFLSISGSRVPGAEKLHEWVTSSPSHTSYSFRDRLRRLRWQSASAGWMEDLALYRFSDYGFIHPAGPDSLNPGDEVMFAFDQDELTYAPSVAAYYPPPYFRNRAIGTATVDADGNLIPGYWWPERRPEEAQKLDQPVQLREGVRKARPGEYQLHEGISAHLPAPAPQAAPVPEPDQDPVAQPWAQEAPAALGVGTPGPMWTSGDNVPSALDVVTSSPDSAGTPTPDLGGSDVAGAPVSRAGSPGPEPRGARRDAAPKPVEQDEATRQGSAPESGPKVPFPRLKKAEQTALADVTRGAMTRFGGLFMLQTHPVRRAAAASQDAVAKLIGLKLAEVEGQGVRPTSQGLAWFGHHGVEMPSRPEATAADGHSNNLASAGSSSRAMLLVTSDSIDYSPTTPAKVVNGAEWPQPPAPESFPDDWYTPSSDPDAEAAARGKAARAKERFAHSTARDIAALAIPVPDDRWLWTRHRPLAQFDENAAAALERLTDPATAAYTIQAIQHLRKALEEIGRGATEDYLQRILAAGNDPALTDKAWRTDLGVSSDPTYALHVRAVVINYLVEVAAHAEAAGLDGVAVAEVLEDAAGWDGRLQQFGKTASEQPHFPAAEAVVKSAQFVAEAALHLATGSEEKVRTWIELQRNASEVEPRPTRTQTAATGHEEASATQAAASPVSTAGLPPRSAREELKPVSAGGATDQAGAAIPLVPPSAETTEPYTYPREATEAWRLVVDTMGALDASHRTWPRTSRNHIALTDVKTAVARIATRTPAVPSSLPEVAHQLRELERMLDVVQGDLDRSRDEELKARLGPLLSALVDAHALAHDRTQAAARQLTRNEAGTWLHPWVTELPEGTRPSAEVRAAGTSERPRRVLQADGTPLQHIGSGAESAARAAVAVGVVDAPHGTGEWQVVRFEDGTHEVAHPALLHPVDQEPYPLPEDLDMPVEAWALRWQAFDRAEAAGATTASVGVGLITPGDRIQVPDRKGERTVTSVERGVRRRSGRKQLTGTAVHHRGAGKARTAEYLVTNPEAALAVTLPAEHPALDNYPGRVVLTQDPIPPDSYHQFSSNWTATVTGGHEGKYSVMGDCQGKVRNGVPDHKTYLVHYSHGEGKESKVWSLGRATTLEGAAEYISSHWQRSQTGDHRAEAQQDDYAAGLWLLPDVGEGEYLVYQPDGSWELTSREGLVYDIRDDRSARVGNLEVRHGGDLVGVTTEHYERRWPQMLGIARSHSERASSAEADAEPVVREGLGRRPEAVAQDDVAAVSTAPVEGLAAQGGPVAEAVQLSDEASADHEHPVDEAGQDATAGAPRETEALFELPETETPGLGRRAVAPDGDGLGFRAEQQGSPVRAQPDGLEPSDRERSPREPRSRDDRRSARSETAGPEGERGHSETADSHPVPRQAARPGDAVARQEGGAQDREGTEQASLDALADRSLGPSDGADTGQVTAGHEGGSAQADAAVEGPPATLTAGQRPSPDRAPAQEGEGSTTVSDASTASGPDHPTAEQPAQMTPNPAAHTGQVDETSGPAAESPLEEGMQRQHGEARGNEAPPRPALAELEAYADPSAYEAAHQDVLAALDQHENWLNVDAAAAAAASELVATSGVNPPALAALLALGSATAAAEGQDPALAALTDQLRHHVRRTQLTMARIVVDQAARTTDRDLLRNLHTVAVAGRFIGFQGATDAGEMEIGRYIDYRTDQLSQQATAPANTAEPGADTAEADLSVDEYDESALPALEFPDGGGAYFSYTEGELPLHTRATARLQGPAGTSGELVFVNGRPIYAMVIEQAGQGDTAVRSLLLGLSLGDDARAVRITAEELAAADPQRLMAAVNSWIAADDTGDRPLLTYLPTAHTALATPDPVASAAVQAQPAQASTTPETASAVPRDYSRPAPAPAGGKQTQAAHSTPATAESAAPMSSDDRAPDPSAQPSAPTGGRADPLAAGSDASSPREEEQPVREEPGGAATAVPQAPAEQLEEPDAADRLAVLARIALGSLSSRREVTVTMAAPDHAVVTVEATGHSGRDAYLTGSLRQALNKEISSQSDRSLNRLRIDVQHGVTGQTLLPANGPAATVPRSRLIEANAAAAQLFTTRLRTDPNAELARTYLHEGDPAASIKGRQIPPEVQEQWGIGYAPSPRGSGSWDVLVQELTGAGFSEEELVQSGLAKYSQNGRLYDAFSDRIVFPIHNQVGEIVGFGGRRIDRPGESSDEAKDRGGPKYLNTEDTAVFRKGELVFGLYHPAQAEAREASTGPRVGLEGYFDVIATARAAEGLPLEQRPVAGAPMGTALTKDQLTALRGIQEGKARTHVMFGDNDPAGRRALLKSWDMLLTTPGTTEVTSASDVKDAADLWEAGVAAGTGGAEPVLRALDQRQPLLEAAVEAQLMVFAADSERANHVFDGGAFNARARAAATLAAQLITAETQYRAPQDVRERQAAALTWAKRLHQTWQLPGHLVATAVLLGPGNHDVDTQNAVYQQALDVLATDPDGYFTDDQHVRSRQSAIFADEDAEPAAAPAAPASTRVTGSGRWPVGTKPGVPTATATAVEGGPLPFAMSLHGPRPEAAPVELADRNAGAYSLYVAVHDRLGQHAIEEESPGHLAQPLALGSMHGIDLATSGADQQAEDPSIVVWLGTESLRLTYQRFTAMTPLEFLAAVEWRAAATAGKIGAPLSQAWRKAVRTILAPSMPHNPGPEDFAVLLDTVAATADGRTDETRRRAQQAVDLYTAGHPDLALDHLAAADHIWVLRNDGGWVQESAGAEPTWQEVSENLAQQTEALNQLGQEAAGHPSPEVTAAEPPVAADLTIAHHSAHEAIAALRPYSIGLPGTVYEQITDLVAQMDASVPAVRRLRGPGGERLMGRVRTSLVRALEGLATAAGKIRLRGVADRLERAVSRLRGQGSQPQPSRAVRVDRRLQDLNHTERDLERRMAAPGTAMAEIGDLQEQWIINRARWRARYEQITGQPATADFLPHNGLIAGAPAIPNPVAAHDMLIARLRTRVSEERDVDPHTGEMSDPWNATADLFNGVAWAYQQRLIGSIPTGPDPEGPVTPEQLRQAALIVTARRDASPLTLRRALDVSAERADRLLHRLEAQQVLGPYRPDTTRTVLAQSGEIDALLARPARPRPSAPTPPDASPQEAAQSEFNGRRAEIEEVVTKFLAEQTARNDGQPDIPSNRAAAASGRGHAAPRDEAQSNALAAQQTTQLTPSQS